MRYDTLPTESLASWAQFNGVKLNGITIASSITDQHGNDKGGGLLATEDHDPGKTLLSVPAELILSSAQVDEYAKSDRDLREVLDSVGQSFSQNPRKKIMIFLLLQLTHSSPDFVGKRVGTSSPFTDYVRYLPKTIQLPTFYSVKQTQLAAGTSLSQVLAQKLNSLEQDFDHLRASTESISWCQQMWWDDVQGRITIDDWKLVDAIYRSRALDLPGVSGVSMVPSLDMANHAPEPECNARFEMDNNGNALLVVREDVHISKDQEITIMYSTGGACEMIFSYGFLDDKMPNAREIFLDMEMPVDDPLAVAKIRFAQQTPGIQIHHDEAGSIQWQSAYTWWACMNEEDGLEFDVAQTNDGERELQATWKGMKLARATNLASLLQQDEQYEIFLLRATVLVQERVEQQGQELAATQDDIESKLGVDGHEEQNFAWKMIKKLRDVELNTLVTSYHWLESEKSRLMESESVRKYLTPQETLHPSDMTADEDFS